MNFKEIANSIAEAESIPAGKVRKVTKALLARMSDALENGEKLRLPGLSFNPKTLPAKNAEGDKPARPERKIAIMSKKTPKSN